MKKFIYLLFILGFIVETANAQNDPNAKKILDGISAKLKTFKGISADFALTSKGKNGKLNNNVRGKISIKGNKYYIKQAATEIFSDGAKTWNYNGNDEVTVTTVDADAQTLTPQKLLTDFYDKDSKMTFTCYEPNGLASVMTIDLKTNAVVNQSKAPGTYNECEGIFPDGKYTLVEGDRQCEWLGGKRGGSNIDIWKLKLDGTGKNFVRLTKFNDHEGGKASNPVVSTDGKYIQSKPFITTNTRSTNLTNVSTSVIAPFTQYSFTRFF